MNIRRLVYIANARLSTRSDTLTGQVQKVLFTGFCHVSFTLFYTSFSFFTKSLHFFTKIDRV